jgi:hypothetical protein
MQPMQPRIHANQEDEVLSTFHSYIFISCSCNTASKEGSSIHMIVAFKTVKTVTGGAGSYRRNTNSHLESVPREMSWCRTTTKTTTRWMKLKLGYKFVWFLLLLLKTKFLPFSLQTPNTTQTVCVV